MRVVIIGGSGHVGTYLVPRLVEAGHTVINLSRSLREPYQPHAAWKSVEQINVNREAEDEAGTFGKRVRALKPEVVIDMICFKLTSAQHLVESLKGEIGHFLHCGTIWIHGPTTQAPMTELEPRRPFGEYGIQKAAIEAYLLKEAHQNNFPASLLHPGHIVGPGWNPLNPAGHFNPAVFETLAAGDELALPNLGMETVHHVHADDVAQSFMQALTYRSAALGESFHVTSAAALSLRGYAEAMAAWFGQTAHLKFMPWEEWKATVSADEARATWDHIAHSPCASIAKAQRLINYQPRYSSLQAVYESVSWMMEKGLVKVKRS
jgi:nucleoside-diphosphate-sugar epimerase